MNEPQPSPETLSMASVRSRLIRLILRHVVGPKFKRAGTSVSALRSLDGMIIKNQKVPPGTEIQPVSVNGVPAEWVRAREVRTGNAILYLHGGAFIMCSPATHRELAARLSASANARVLVPRYRLAPEHPFPAAMEDALSAYHWLLDNGHTRERLAIGGDSSGGGLALQTLITLREKNGSLPSAAVFLSPQADWIRLDGQSYSSRNGVDPLQTPEMCRSNARHYVGDNDPDTTLLNPLEMDLSGLPPLCIHVGDHDLLLSDSVRLAERARASNVDVDLKVWEGMWHVFQTSARFVPEARQSLDDIGRFIVNRLG